MFSIKNFIVFTFLDERLLQGPTLNTAIGGPKSQPIKYKVSNLNLKKIVAKKRLKVSLTLSTAFYFFTKDNFI